jgi:hypothetical protein
MINPGNLPGIAPHLPGGPAGPGPGGIPGQPDSPSAARALDDAIAAVARFLDSERDPQDKAVAAKVLAQLHSLAGGRAKEADAAMGTSPTLKFVRRTLSS